jgi:amidohydrolase
MSYPALATLSCCVLLLASAAAQTKPVSWTTPSAEEINAVYPEVESLYFDLHRTPELAMHEQQTAAKLADRVKAMGYEVTTGVGGTGVVAVLRNGKGPTVLLRTDMDALPIAEETGLSFASHVVVKSDSGTSIPVMHACGHDIHMSSWVGTAKLMATNRDRWRGTLVLIGQPAEETGEGAAAMIKDGLLTRFPKPDFALAIHDSAVQPVGQIGFTPGYALAAADSVDITIFGKGGHGGRPQNTIDPVVIAARTVLALQTIVSRENNPFDPVVITVGTIHGGTKNSIIPGEVKHALVRGEQGVTCARDGSGQRTEEARRDHVEQDDGDDVDDQKPEMDPAIRLPKDRQDRGIGRIGPRQLHVVGQLVGRNTLQNELAGIGVLTLIALQRHVQQPPADRSKENDHG